MAVDKSTHYCTRCETTKDVVEFGKNSRSPSGLKSWCRLCSNAYHAEWLAKNPDALAKARNATAHWREANPERMLEHARTYRSRNRDAVLSRKRSSQYREKETAARQKRMADPAKRAHAASVNKSWREANPDLCREISHRASLQRRARQMSVKALQFSAQQLESRLSVFGHRCWMCGGPYEHLDHVKPVKVGGPHMLSNLRPACAACNTAKSSKWYGASGLHRFKK